jgi:hypothetical protein
LLQTSREGITEQRVVLDNQHSHVTPSSRGNALDGRLSVGVDEMRAMAAENLNDSVTLLASVHRDIDDEVPPGELRFVAPKVMALDCQALQRPQGVFHTAAVGPLSVDFPRTLSPGQGGKFALWNASPFECLDCGPCMLSIVNHGHDSVCQVP